MIESEENKEYLPIQGLEAFNKATAQLLLGEGHPAIKEVKGSGSAKRASVNPAAACSAVIKGWCLTLPHWALSLVSQE